METVSERRRTKPLATARGLSLAVADINWFTTENLFAELERVDVSTLLLHCLDYRNAWRQGGRPWTWNRPVRRIGPRHWRRSLALPAGWMKRFPRRGMRPIGKTIDDWRRREAPDGPLALVMTYPHYLFLRDLVRPDVSVYFNVDDYALYWPSRAAEIRALEARAVRESHLTVCTARRRCDELRELVPEAADRIRHLPHGAPAWSVGERAYARPAAPPDDIAHLPRPLLGYVGSMEDRVDWPLLERLADRFPAASIVLVGRYRAEGDEPWRQSLRRVLARPNVHALGWRSQEEVGRYNRAFDVSLIPYLTDHPFNLACCPTKIMDSMGSGRPIVSTDLPECRLHRERFHVADDADAFLRSVDSILSSGSDDGGAQLRHDYAREHTCGRMAARLVEWIIESA